MKGGRLHVTMLDPLATVPYYTAYLSRALLQQSVEVRVASISYYLDRECFRSRGLLLQPGCMDMVSRFPSLPRPVRRVGKLVEVAVNLLCLYVRFLWKAPEILHLQFLPLLPTPLPLDWWFVQALQRRGTRVVLTVHDLLPHDTAERYRREFRKLYRRVDQLICHSAHVAERLRNEFAVPVERVHVIAHGPFFFDVKSAGDPAAVRHRYGVGEGRQLVLWQGILLPYKGLDVLLDAWRILEDRGTDATLIVVGTGSAELVREAKAHVERTRLKHVVLDMRFVGTAELVELYRAAEVAVYPYRQITTSGALATGVALGKAIVASALPAFGELLVDGEDALLVPPEDMDALAAALERLLRDTALRQSLEAAVQGKNFGEEAWRKIANETVAVYDEALRVAPRQDACAAGGCGGAERR